MLFNSVVFFVFATLFYLLWPWFKTKPLSRYIFICVASSIFYGWWNWRYLPLIYISAAIDFVLALLMVKYPQKKKLILGISVGVSLSILASFKYVHFFYDNMAAALGLFDVQLNHALPAITLPIGLSFYTFQSISYTFDVYRGYKPANNFLLFFAYLSLFPQLVAGPIERAPRLLDQIEAPPKRIWPQDIWDGTVLIAKGFFRKVFIADNLAVGVNLAYQNSNEHNSGIFWWIVGVMFAFQIYTDFGGYSDIARGLARWMGYQLMENFRHPYSATSAREFWSRNHISLTIWFRDYLYLPLRGKSRNRAYRALCLWITMIASGFWHGPSWNFIVWGACLAFSYQLDATLKWSAFLNKSKWTLPLAPLLILAQSALMMVFFRGQSLSESGSILAKMGGAGGAASSDGVFPWSYLPQASLIALCTVVAWEIINFIDDKYQIPLIPRSGFAQALAVASMVLASFLFYGPPQSFIYFQF